MLTEIERLGAFEHAEQTFQMNEEAFRVFYDRTARSVWIYLARMTRDDRLADDLLQEAYYRFLRSRADLANDEHRKNYLFRIATNLVHDHRRRLRPASAIADRPAEPIGGDHGERVARHVDLSRAMEHLSVRERSLLWLAYAEGCSHEEIAGALGLKRTSMKALLFRARRRLASLLGSRSPSAARPESERQTGRRR
jgi:RNA polymerase sigma-70 factor (ECF subfamily)